MSIPTICHPVGGDIPLTTLELQSKLLDDVEKLKSPCQLDNMTLEVSITFSGEASDNYVLYNICSLIETHKHSNTYIYFHPRYSSFPISDLPDVDKSISSQSTESPMKLLLANIQCAAISGNEYVVSSGCCKDKKKKNLRTDPTLLYLHCQCLFTNKGSKVDKASGKIVGRHDYWSLTISNNCKNQHSGTKGWHGSQRTDSVKRFSKHDDCCGFRFLVYLGCLGYYVKTGIGCPYHKFHKLCMHIRMPSKLAKDKEQTIVKDLHSAKALTGVAANTHYICSS